MSSESVGGFVVKAVDGVSHPVGPTTGKDESVGLCVGRMSTRVVERREGRVLSTRRSSVHTLTSMLRTLLSTRRLYIVKDRRGVRRRGRVFLRVGALWSKGEGRGMYEVVLGRSLSR